MSSTSQFVSEFYGKTVSRTEDLVFDACCIADYDLSLLSAITDEVKARRYGCGSPLPPMLDGCTVLDLGCGAGIDVYIAAQLVGAEGRVIGIDMTPEQLAIAERNLEPIASNLREAGKGVPVIEFREAKIESLPLEDNSVDVVISNCVINLTPNKREVFEEIWRVLKPGGEFYIADIVADRRIPESLAADKLLYSECLTGAAYLGDLHRTMQSAGFNDVRVVEERLLGDVIEGIHFWSQTLRGFKVELEDQREDYGQVAIYRGTLEGKSDTFTLDTGHVFKAGTAERVCKNTADMLAQSRYASHFVVSAEIAHLGLFDCGPAATSNPAIEVAQKPTSSGSCC